jgi:hypothetical protein
VIRPFLRCRGNRRARARDGVHCAAFDEDLPGVLPEVPRLGASVLRRRVRTACDGRSSDRHAAEWPLPDRVAARRGRHGHRLPGQERPGRSAGGREDHERRAGARRLAQGALSAGGQDQRRAGSPQHRGDPRLRRGRGRAVPGHGAPRRELARQIDRAPSLAGAGGRCHRGADRPGPGPRPRLLGHPSGSEAREHLRGASAQRRALGEDPRLRHRALAPRSAAHQRRADLRDPAVHGARAGGLDRRGAGRGSLRARGHALRDDRGVPAAPRRRHHRVPDRPHEGRAAGPRAGDAGHTARALGSGGAPSWPRSPRTARWTRTRWRRCF